MLDSYDHCDLCHSLVNICRKNHKYRNSFGAKFDISAIFNNLKLQL